MKTGNFLLAGVDFEGDTREHWTQTLPDALKEARRMTNPRLPGPPWQAWAIWGRDDAEQWTPLLTSDDFNGRTPGRAAQLTTK